MHYLFIVLLPILCFSSSIANADSASNWTITFDPNQALFSSITNGIYEITDLYLSPSQVPIIYGDLSLSPSVAVLSSPCTPGNDNSYPNWFCSLTATIPGVLTTCNTPASLRINYTVGLAFTLSPSYASPKYTGWPVLQQNVTLEPLVPNCFPTGYFGVVMPIATSLRPTADNTFTRHLTSVYRSGSLFDYVVATSGDYDGFAFVSAGENWEPPSKQNPAYPGYELAIPVLDEYLNSSSSNNPPPSIRLTYISDFYYFTGFNIGYTSNQAGFVFAYNCSNPAIACFNTTAHPFESRQFYTVIDTTNDPTIDARATKFAATASAHIPPAPSWTSSIALTNYDYFTPPRPLPGSEVGYDADIDALAAAIPLANRSSVLICIHGWYGALGWYTLVNINGTELMQNWTVFPSGAGYFNALTKLPLGPINVTKDIIHQRILHAKNAGFRVVIYFADGLNTCDGVPFYDQQQKLSWYHSYEWIGPDSLGKMYILNPLAEQTHLQYSNYLQGLLIEYGSEIDGFVWDETFELPFNAQGELNGTRGYAARGMMELIEGLTKQVHNYPSCEGRCVFLVAGCMFEMPHMLVSDGTYEDTSLNANAAPYGVVPNYFKALYECGWRASDSTTYPAQETYVDYNIPVGLGNGWGTDVGFSNFTTDQKNFFMNLFLQHNVNSRARYPNITSSSA